MAISGELTARVLAGAGGSTDDEPDAGVVGVAGDLIGQGTPVPGPVGPDGLAIRPMAYEPRG